LHSLIGGALIGLAGALFLLLDGRSAGVSGIIGGALRAAGENQLRNLFFLFGLFLGPFIYRLGFGGWPVVHFEASLTTVALAGLLVGFGSRPPAAPAATASAAWPAFREDRSSRSRHFLPLE
jgi:hypothetical protein